MLAVSAFGERLPGRVPLGALRRITGALLLLFGAAAGAMSVAHGMAHSMSSSAEIRPAVSAEVVNLRYS